MRGHDSDRCSPPSSRSYHLCLRMTSRPCPPCVGNGMMCGTAVITAKGQFERIKPLNWPFLLCPRQDSNLRHPL